MAKVLLVEDDPRIRDVVRALIAGSPHEIIAECDNLADARAALERQRPAVLLMDLGLPDGSGIDLLREARATLLRGTLVLVLTVFDDDTHVFDALRAGAVGYLLKDQIVTRLLTAVDEMLAGGAPMSPQIARRVLESFHPATAAASPPEEELTPRERDVIQLLAEGATYEETGRILRISTNTVRTYVRTTYEKLHVSSKVEATREAMRRGLIRRGS